MSKKPERVPAPFVLARRRELRAIGKTARRERGADILTAAELEAADAIKAVLAGKGGSNYGRVSL